MRDLHKRKVATKRKGLQKCTTMTIILPIGLQNMPTSTSFNLNFFSSTKSQIITLKAQVLINIFEKPVNLPQV